MICLQLGSIFPYVIACIFYLCACLWLGSFFCVCLLHTLCDERGEEEGVYLKSL